MAAFQRMAKEALAGDLRPRESCPILAGGTGFYIQALLYDIDFRDDTGEGPHYREELEKLAVERRQRSTFTSTVWQQADPQSS